MVAFGLLSIVGLLALVACRSSGPAPDLGALYDRAARHHDEHRNPVILIPGALGTRLIDPLTGQVVWGAFGGTQAATPAKPHGARLAALPMRQGATLSELRDGVVADGVLESMRIKLAGLPFQLKAYLQILTTLGVGGYHDGTVDYGDVDYGDEHFTCFQFPYDWRRDVAENARLLHEYILEKRAFVLDQSRRRFGRADPNFKFDLVAHSLGGVVSRYMLRYGSADLPADGSLPPLTWEGSSHVERAILIGTPNAGSLDGLRYLVDGRKFGPFTPTYPPALLGTYPSLYQLLPRARHGALVEAGAPDQVLDLLDPELWQTLGWGLAAPDQEPVLQVLLPAVASAADRRRIALEHQVKNLRRARQLHAALDRPARRPEGLKLYLVAGDAAPTGAVAAVDRATGKLTVTAHGPGDGTVLRSSALMDERLGQTWTPKLRTPIDWTQVTFLFSDHLGMTRDPAFTDNLLYLLLEQPAGPWSAGPDAL